MFSSSIFTLLELVSGANVQALRENKRFLPNDETIKECCAFLQNVVVPQAYFYLLKLGAYKVNIKFGCFVVVCLHSHIYFSILPQWLYSPSSLEGANLAGLKARS